MAKHPAVSIHPLLWYVKNYLTKARPTKGMEKQHALAKASLDALLALTSGPQRAWCKICPGAWPSCMAEAKVIIRRIGVKSVAPRRRKISKKR